jgi:hypothetical protein
MDVSLSGNVMQQSCQTNLLVAFARHTTALGLQQDAYLLNSTYRLQLGGEYSVEGCVVQSSGGFRKHASGRWKPDPEWSATIL